ncbi:hypothetical protein Tco_0734489 [Tanacetum coccineum]
MPGTKPCKAFSLGFLASLGDLLYFLDQLRTPLIVRNEFERCKIEGANFGGQGRRVGLRLAPDHISAATHFGGVTIVPEQGYRERQVMAASTIPVSAEENLGDPIDIWRHCEDTSQHGSLYAGYKHFIRVPIQEELTALRFRADIAEVENVSLRAMIKTIEAIEKITRNRERQAFVLRIEQQLCGSRVSLSSGPRGL